jgi:hypothetical protein
MAGRLHSALVVETSASDSARRAAAVRAQPRRAQAVYPSASPLGASSQAPDKNVENSPAFLTCVNGFSFCAFCRSHRARLRATISAPRLHLQSYGTRHRLRPLDKQSSERRNRRAKKVLPSWKAPLRSHPFGGPAVPTAGSAPRGAIIKRHWFGYAEPVSMDSAPFVLAIALAVALGLVAYFVTLGVVS